MPRWPARPRLRRNIIRVTATDYPYGGNVVGQVLNQVLGGGYGYNGYGANSQVAVNQCAAAVQQRLGGGYGGTAITAMVMAVAGCSASAGLSRATTAA